MKENLANNTNNHSRLLFFEKLVAISFSVIFSSAFFVITYIIFIGFRNEPPIPLPIPVHYIANFDTSLDFTITPFRISLVIYICLISFDYLLTMNLRAIPYILFSKMHLIFIPIFSIYVFQTMIYILFEFDINYQFAKLYVIILILNLIVIALILGLALLFINPESMSRDEFLEQIKEYFSKYEKLSDKGEFVSSEKGDRAIIIPSFILVGSMVFFVFLNLSGNPFVIENSGVKLFLMLSPFVFYFGIYLIFNRKYLMNWLKFYKLTFQKSEAFDEITPDMFKCKMQGSILNYMLCERIYFRINNAKFIAEGLIPEYYQDPKWNIEAHSMKQSKKDKLFKIIIFLIYCTVNIMFYLYILSPFLGTIVSLSLTTTIIYYSEILYSKIKNFQNRKDEHYSIISVIKSIISFIIGLLMFFVIFTIITGLYVYYFGAMVAVISIVSIVIGIVVGYFFI
jgi:hypothetical protein